MKKTLLFALMNLFILSTHAQKEEASKVPLDKIEFNEYTIAAVQNQDGSYGYTISKGTQFIKYQGLNPFNFAVKGLKKKEEAFEVAKWELKNLKQGEGLATTLSKPIPKKVAQELNIDLGL
jgi:hypothetical protein